MGDSLEPMSLEDYGITIDLVDNRSETEIAADCADGFDDALAEEVTDTALDAMKQKARDGELNLEDPEVADNAAAAIQREALIAGFDSCDDSRQPAPRGPGIPMS